MPKNCTWGENHQVYEDGATRCDDNHIMVCRDGEWKWENEYCHEPEGHEGHEPNHPEK